MKRRNFRTCRWKTCSRPPVEGEFFCSNHLKPPEREHFGKWLEALPEAVIFGIAGNFAYDKIKPVAVSIWQLFFGAAGVAPFGESKIPPLSFLKQLAEESSANREKMFEFACELLSKAEDEI